MKKMREPPSPADLRAIQAEYEHHREMMEETHLSEVRLAVESDDHQRYRNAVLRWDCRRYEFLMMFENPVAAEEAWVERLHPLTAFAVGYR